jgi:imidazolonepropionase
VSELQVWTHASEILTGEGIRRNEGRHPQEEDLGRILDGAVAFDQKKVLWVGETSKLPKRYLKYKAKSLRGQKCVIPGLIDCHTHLIFAGDRADEFSDRCAGATYEEIAARGGGILKTVEATRRTSEKELLNLALVRTKEIERRGVRTIEVKTGYGLDQETELKCLRVARELKRRCPHLTFHITYLGAHAIPKGRTSRDYLNEMEQVTLPLIAKQKLADSIDIFVDRGYFSTSEAKQFLIRAKELEFPIRIHADELVCTHSAELAAEIGALSADHLLQISERGIQMLAKSQTTAVLLPGTAFFLKTAQAPARKLLEAGARVALSTDFNPGSSMTLSLPLIMTFGALSLGMSRSEIFAAVTYNAACALGLQAKKGTIAPGMSSDIVAHPFQKFEEIYYRFGW